jgi:uncharacterized protein (DUF2249 family)
MIGTGVGLKPLPRPLAYREGNNGYDRAFTPPLDGATLADREDARYEVAARPASGNHLLDRAADLQLDVRHLPIGSREAAILPTLCTMAPRSTVLVVSDRDSHALAADLELTYPGKFVLHALPRERDRHRVLIVKLGETHPFRTPWESALASSWSIVRDPT